MKPLSTLELARQQKQVQKTLTQLKEILENGNNHELTVYKENVSEYLLNLLPLLGYKIKDGGFHSRMQGSVFVISWDKKNENNVYEKTIQHLAS